MLPHLTTGIYDFEAVLPQIWKNATGFSDRAWGNNSNLVVTLAYFLQETEMHIGIHVHGRLCSVPGVPFFEAGSCSKLRSSST